MLSSIMSQMDRADGRPFILVDGERLYIEDGHVNGEPVSFFTMCEVGQSSIVQKKKETKELKQNTPSKRNGLPTTSTFTKGPDKDNIEMLDSSDSSGSDTTEFIPPSAKRPDRQSDRDSESTRLEFESEDERIVTGPCGKVDINFPMLKVIKNWTEKNPSYVSKMVNDKTELVNVLWALNPQILLKRVTETDYKRSQMDIDEKPNNVANDSNNISEDSSESFTILNGISLTSPKKTKLIAKGYRIDEDKAIIQYVLKNDNNTKVNGAEMWKNLEKCDHMPYVRSWQSLRNRYLKSILYNLRSYGLSNEDEKKLLVGAQKGVMKRLSVERSSSKLSVKFGKAGGSHAEQKSETNKNVYNMFKSKEKRKLFSTRRSFIRSANNSSS